VFYQRQLHELASSGHVSVVSFESVATGPLMATHFGIVAQVIDARGLGHELACGVLN
jgi:hypothetical protein